MSKVIAVFGSTGKQGGSVARSLLKRGFKVRGITRNPDSDKAKELIKVGAEVVKGDLDDVSSLLAAVEGAYGVFLVTDFWEHMSKEREIKQGKAVVDACKIAVVKHLVFSGLELVKDIMGKDCPHFDGKGEVDNYIQAVGVPNTIVRYPFYFENFMWLLQKQEDGSKVFTINMKGALDAIAVEDGGPAVASIFERPKEFIGRKVGLSAEKITPEAYMAIISKITGKTYTFQYVPEEVYAKFPFPGADDLAVMFDFNERCNPDRDVALTKILNPDVRDFESWVKDNKEKL